VTKGTDFSFLKSFQTASGVHPAQ